MTPGVPEQQSQGCWLTGFWVLGYQVNCLRRERPYHSGHLPCVLRAYQIRPGSQEISISAFGIFRCTGETAVILIQRSRAFEVFVIFGKGTQREIGTYVRTLLARRKNGTIGQHSSVHQGTQLIAGDHALDVARRVPAKRPVDGVTIEREAYDRRMAA